MHIDSSAQLYRRSSLSRAFRWRAVVIQPLNTTKIAIPQTNSTDTSPLVLLVTLPLNTLLEWLGLQIEREVPLSL